VFVSEPIEPEPGSFSTDAMATGLAALPGAFRWRGRRYVIVRCLRHAKQGDFEGHSIGGDRYLRRQTFDVELDTGEVAQIYVLRNAPRGARRDGAARRRWFLYSIETGGDESAN
jgi:hypothetical protein